MTSFVCDYCGISTQKLSSRYNDNAVKHFCSVACRHEFNKQRLQSLRHLVSCNNCGKDKYVKNYTKERNTMFFCDRKCKDEHHRKFPIRGKDSPRWVEKIEIPCDWCGTVLYRTEWQKNLKNLSFCNKKCCGKWLSKNQSGENHPCWEGGLVEIGKRIRHNIKTSEWRVACFTRDKFTCQDCGDSKGGNLHAHHIYHFGDILKDFNITTIEEAMGCKTLWDEANGITLCKTCHETRHKKEKV